MKRLLELFVLSLFLWSVAASLAQGGMTLQPSPTPTDTLKAAYAQAAAYDYQKGNTAWNLVSHTFDGVEMVLVPPGCFEMGNDLEAWYWDGAGSVQGVPDGGRQCFDEPFWIDKYEVTNAQYKRCVDAGGCEPPSARTYYDNPSYDDHPVVYLDWFQAKKYAEWRGGALPTEREWEYAARGPDNPLYPWGDEFVSDNLVYSGNSSGTAVVGSRPGGVSWVGALDLSGNVWEWVGSAYRDYPYRPDDGREDLDRVDVLWVLRGGSWLNLVDLVRCASRLDFSPFDWNGLSGFRVVLHPLSPLSSCLLRG